MQRFIKLGAFLNFKKLHQVILLPKGKSTGLICLLDTSGKLLERIIFKRLLDIAEQNEGFTEVVRIKKITVFS